MTRRNHSNEDPNQGMLLDTDMVGGLHPAVTTEQQAAIRDLDAARVAKIAATGSRRSVKLVAVSETVDADYGLGREGTVRTPDYRRPRGKLVEMPGGNRGQNNWYNQPPTSRELLAGTSPNDRARQSATNTRWINVIKDESAARRSAPKAPADPTELKDQKSKEPALHWRDRITAAQAEEAPVPGVADAVVPSVDSSQDPLASPDFVRGIRAGLEASGVVKPNNPSGGSQL